MAKKLDWSKVPPKKTLTNESVDVDKFSFGIDKLHYYTEFTFGKYKSRRILQVWLFDEKYCRWVYENITKLSKAQKSLLYQLIETPCGNQYMEFSKQNDLYRGPKRIDG